MKKGKKWWKVYLKPGPNPIKRNLVLKKTKLDLNSILVPYFDLGYNNILFWPKLKFKAPLWNLRLIQSFLRLHFSFIGLSPGLALHPFILLFSSSGTGKRRKNSSFERLNKKKIVREKFRNCHSKNHLALPRRMKSLCNRLCNTWAAI